MRPNVSRSRITDRSDKERSANASYFFVHPGPIATFRDYRTLLWRLVVALGGATLVISIAWLYPMTEASFQLAYCPLLFFALGPVLARAAGMPLIVLVLLAWLYVFITVDRLTPHTDPSMKPVSGIIVLALLAPAVARVVVSMSRLSSVAAPVVAVLVTVCACLAAILQSNPAFLEQVSLLYFVLALPFAVLLIKVHAGRLAGSTGISPQAAYRYADLSRWLFEFRDSSVPSRWRWMLIAVSSAYAAWHVQAWCWALLKLFAAPFTTTVRNGIAFEAFILTIHTLVIPAFISCMAFSWYVGRYIVVTARGLLNALTIWETDEHPAPNAPGIRSAVGFDLAGLPLRSITLAAFLTLSGFLSTVTNAPPAYGEREGFARIDVLGHLPLVVLQHVLIGTAILFALFVAVCAPWFAYFDFIKRSTDFEKDDGDV